MKRFFATFVVAVGLFYAGIFYHQTHPSPATVFARTSASIVRITGEKTEKDFFGEETTAPYTCTGEVIAQNKVLTAEHCVGEKLRADGRLAQVLRKDEYYDLALLAVKTGKKPALTLREADVELFEPLMGIGYAFGWSTLTPLQVSGAVINKWPEPKLAPGIFVQTDYIGGMSGGPVVDHRGRMVSIVQQRNQGLGYGVGTLIIRAFLLGM